MAVSRLHRRIIIRYRCLRTLLLNMPHNRQFRRVPGRRHVPSSDRPTGAELLFFVPSFFKEAWVHGGRRYRLFTCMAARNPVISRSSTMYRSSSK